METAILAVGLFLLATSVLPPSNALAWTVNELLAQFKDFGPKYVDFRKMPNKPAQEKDNALEELWKTVQAYQWDTDTDTNFFLASVDPSTFKGRNESSLFSDVGIMFAVGSTKNDLKGIQPHTLFQDPSRSTDKLFPEVLNAIELPVKKKMAKYSGKAISKVAYHYELFNGQDLTKANDPNARKEYALLMFAIGTK